MTAETDATTRADGHIRAAQMSLRPEATLRLQSSSIDPVDDPTDGGPPGRVSVARRYWLEGVDPAPETFDRLAGFWQANGYLLIRDGRQAPYPHLWAEHPADGFRVGLDRNVTGELLLGASSPAFWPTAPV